MPHLKADLPLQWVSHRRSYLLLPRAGLLWAGLDTGCRGCRKEAILCSPILLPRPAGTQAYTAAQSADLVLIPCRPSLVDLDAIRRTAQLVKSAGINAFVLFNAAQPEQPRCLRTRGVSWQAPD